MLFEIFRDKVSMHLLAARLETVLGMGTQFRFDGHSILLESSC
jgi:hypothetical protein